MNTLPDSAIGVMRLMPNNDKSVAQFSKQLIESVRSGNVNPLELLVMLRSLEAVSELVREEIQDNINTEADKYSEKKFEAFNAIIEKCEVGVKYDFEVCGDPTFERLEVDYFDAKDKLDERMEFLKKLSEPTPIGDTVTGELVTVHPPIKRSKQGTRVYLKHKS